jgi:hypothetical protein
VSEELEQYRQSSQPFIVFPPDDSFEGWEQVATDLEEMINYLIEQKAEKVVVKYVDGRDIDGSVEHPRDYGLAVEVFRQPGQHPVDPR